MTPELDAQKSQDKSTEYKAKLKKVQRVFKDYTSRGTLKDTVSIEGNKVRFGTVAQEPNLFYFSWLSAEHQDDRLLASAYQLPLQRPDLQVILMSADIGVYIKAEHMGFPCLFLSHQDLNPQEN